MTAQLESHALVDHIAATLQTRVLSGEIPTGARLRQEALAAEFGVSRTPVREALRKLQAGGLVELAPHRGAVVRGPSAREIREAYVVRAELEGLAAELATTRIHEQQLQGLRDSVALFRRSIGSIVERRRSGSGRATSDIENWTRANDSFHQGILEAAGNERLRATLFDLHLSFPRDLTGLVLSESSPSDPGERRAARGHPRRDRAPRARQGTAPDGRARPARRGARGAPLRAAPGLDG